MIPRSAARATKSGSSRSSSATTGQPPTSVSSSISSSACSSSACSLTIAMSGSSSAIAAAAPSGEVARADHLVTERPEHGGDAVERPRVLVGDQHAQAAVEPLD